MRTCWGRCRARRLRGAPVAVDRDAVLADGADARDERVRDTYDKVAESYSKARRRLTDKPFDGLAARAGGVLAGERSDALFDAGCVPDNIASSWPTPGARVSGADLSPQMVAGVPSSPT